MQRLYVDGGAESCDETPIPFVTNSHPCKKRKGGAASVSKGRPAPLSHPTGSAEVAVRPVRPLYDPDARRSAAHCVISGIPKLDQAQVPKHLELLPYLWSYI